MRSFQTPLTTQSHSLNWQFSLNSYLVFLEKLRGSGCKGYRHNGAANEWVNNSVENNADDRRYVILSPKCYKTRPKFTRDVIGCNNCLGWKVDWILLLLPFLLGLYHKYFIKGHRVDVKDRYQMALWSATAGDVFKGVTEDVLTCKEICTSNRYHIFFPIGGITINPLNVVVFSVFTYRCHSLLSIFIGQLSTNKSIYLEL